MLSEHAAQIRWHTNRVDRTRCSSAKHAAFNFPLENAHTERVEVLSLSVNRSGRCARFARARKRLSKFTQAGQEAQAVSTALGRKLNFHFATCMAIGFYLRTRAKIAIGAD